MAIRHLPTIAEKDYDAFRRLLNDDLPRTYLDWLQRRFQMASDFQAKWYVVESVEVNPYEFVRYCATNGAGHNMHSLSAFAFEQSKAN